MNYNLSMTPSTIKSKRARLILTYTILNDFSVGGPYCASIMLLDTLKKHSTLQQKTRSINVLIVLMFDTVFVNVQYCKLHYRGWPTCLFCLQLQWPSLCAKEQGCGCQSTNYTIIHTR